MSMINNHFEIQKPFIYQKTDLFAPLWAAPSPLAVSTQEAEAKKAKLMKHVTKLHEDLWTIMLTEILVSSFGESSPPMTPSNLSKSFTPKGAAILIF